MEANGSKTSIAHWDSRDNQRFSCEKSISYSSFAKRETFEGSIRNFSKSGFIMHLNPSQIMENLKNLGG